MNVYDYQGEINKYLRYGKKKDPMDLGPDPTGPIESMGEAMFGQMDEWKKYRDVNNGNTSQEEKEEETPEVSPTEAPVAPVDTPPETAKPASLNTSLWEKASTSPKTFSLYGDNDEQKLTAEDKAFFKRGAEDGAREQENTITSTDDPFISKRNEINQRYGVDDAFRAVKEHKKNFWHSTPKDQVVFNQKLQKARAAAMAADREMELYLATRPQEAGPDTPFTSGKGIDPATGKPSMMLGMKSGAAKSLWELPQSEVGGGADASRVRASDIVTSATTGVGGFVDGGKFMPIEDTLRPAGPAPDGTTAYDYFMPQQTPRTASVAPGNTLVDETTGKALFNAQPRPAREVQSKADPLDKEIAKAELELSRAEAAAKTAPRVRKKDAQAKADAARLYLEDLRARKGGAQPGAAPPAAPPLATVTTPSGAKVSVRKKSE